MGEILIDHSGGINDAKDKLELRSESCQHCQAVIAILRRGCNEFVLSSTDIGGSAKIAHEASQEYIARFRCSKCGNICRACAKEMEILKYCPGSFKQNADKFRRQLELARQRG